MYTNILSFAHDRSDRRYRIYLSSHMQLLSQPERVRRDLNTICPNTADAMLETLLAGEKLSLREGRFEALSPLATRLYSLGFQIELVALD